MMQRHIYRAVTMLLLFIGALVFLVGRQEELTFHIESITEMAEATFPTIYLLNREQEMNPLHGYSTNMDADILRESLTPIDAEKYFHVVIEEHGSRVKRLLYEIWDDQGINMLDSGSISAMEEHDGNKMVKVRIKTEMEEEQEYFVKLTAVTATGKKIRYFTRIKYTPEDHLLDNLAFVKQFHTTLFDKERAAEIRPYLETDKIMDNSSFAYVNIHSSLDVVTWGQLSVKKKTEPVPILVENTANTTAVQLKYMVEAETASGIEEYYITEFYRVQWTRNAMYLLVYERRMEAAYDPAETSLAKSELKLGIADTTDLDIVASGANTRLCFVKERELWYYNVAENKAVRVFSFREPGSLDQRELYDQHDIRVLNMDDSGNIDFMVYGYMNRGVYEGRVAVVLYRFYAGENRIEEQVYIPLETTYQILKEDLDRLSYVSGESIFYFSLYNTLYAYNIITKQVDIVAEDVTEATSLVFPDKRRVVWQSSSQVEQSKKLIIMDLETREQQELTAPMGKVYKLLGGIADNMIYGVAKSTEVVRSLDGTILVPMEQIVIADAAGISRKDYRKEGIHITDVSVEDNVITLERKQKSESGEWLEAEEDHILNHMTVEKPVIGISDRVTELTLTEHYITLPYGYVLEHVPETEETDVTIIREETTLRLSVTEDPPKRYYTHIHGEISNTYLEAADAIAEAYRKMGYVTNEENRIVWERGGRLRNALISGIDILHSEDMSLDVNTRSKLDCVRMLLAHRYIEVDIDELRSHRENITELLDRYLGDSALNLAGVTLDEVLYYINRGCPVIALMEDGSAVLLVGYDEYNITYIDPIRVVQSRLNRSSMEEKCEKAGNIFISYIP